MFIFVTSFLKVFKTSGIPSEITTGSLSKNNFNSFPLLLAEIFFPARSISSISFSLFVLKNEAFFITLFLFACVTNSAVNLTSEISGIMIKVITTSQQTERCYLDCL